METWSRIGSCESLLHALEREGGNPPSSSPPLTPLRRVNSLPASLGLTGLVGVCRPMVCLEPPQARGLSLARFGQGTRWPFTQARLLVRLDPCLRLLVELGDRGASIALGDEGGVAVDTQHLQAVAPTLSGAPGEQQRQV